MLHHEPYDIINKYILRYIGLINLSANQPLQRRKLYEGNGPFRAIVKRYSIKKEVLLVLPIWVAEKRQSESSMLLNTLFERKHQNSVNMLKEN